MQKSLLNHLLTTIVSQFPNEVCLQNNCVVVVDRVLTIDVDDDVNFDDCLLKSMPKIVVVSPQLLGDHCCC